MDAKDKIVFCVLLLLSLGLFGSLSLTYCVWNKQTEVASELQNEWHTQSEVKSGLKIELVGVQNELLMLNSKLQSELVDVRNELHDLQNKMKLLNSRVYLGASEPSQDKGQLKRNVRQADEDADTPSATEILTNALTEIIEMKLVSYMNCDKNEYNHTKCTLKPGPKGEPGSEGEKGTKGERGDMGYRGEPGDKGGKGNVGFPGYKGEKGKEGVVGPQGPPGPTGPQGPRGIQGEIGERGDMGQKGEPGDKGMKGNPGFPGYKGEPGPRGSIGERGEKGDMGERGLKGDMGPLGPQGETGERGDMGQKGEPGNNGMKGNQGYKGEKGEQGGADPQVLPNLPQCGGTGGWRRVAFLDITDASHVCPTGLNLTTYSRRTCGRAHSGYYSCSSTTFSVNGSQYSRVCGRAQAYRFGWNYGFFGYYGNIYGQGSIESQYVDGLSLTHGVPGSRQHIWTFASATYTRNYSAYPIAHRTQCPCDTGKTSPLPPFVGNNYFCESVLADGSWNTSEVMNLHFYPNAILWDGQVCEGGGTCCQFNNPPWFTKNLANSTTDDIELRLCLADTSQRADVALELLELYVQ